MLLLEIASPQILIPVSPFSNDMIIAELGNIAISNEIILKQAQETIPQYEAYLFGYIFDIDSLTSYRNIISVNITNMTINSIRNNKTYPFLNEVLLKVAIQEPMKQTKNVPKQKVASFTFSFLF